MHDVYDIDDLVKKLNSSGNWFYGFLSKGSIDAGLLRLIPGEKDPQGPHSSDELYYVIKGTGYINIGNENAVVKPGTLIFVPAKKDHHFYGNKDELQALYVFAGEDKDA